MLTIEVETSSDEEDEINKIKKIEIVRQKNRSSMNAMTQC